MLAGLVGVDFDLTSSNAPTNWTSIGTQNTPFSQSNLIDEAGTATPFDLTISETGSATATCGANQICAAAATPSNSTLPIHTQSLSGIDGQIYTDADPVTLTWSDLTAGTDYEVYVFGLEGFFGSIQQDVQITGAGSPISFTQSFDQDSLFINDEVGSSSRPLSSYAEIVTADSSGEITIQVTPNGFTLDVSLGGVAIRELPAPQLTVTIAADSISEAAGAGATTATVSRNTDTTSDLVVDLASDDTSEATVPPTVTIPAGQSISPPFNINAIDDIIIDGTQLVTVTATAIGLAAGTDTVDVTDDDAPVLTVSIAAAAIAEGDGAAATTATVSRNTDTANALTVNLASSDTSEATVPATVTIAAGQTTSAPFDIDAVNDADDDGTQTVTVTANAAAHGDGTDTVEVVDDDVVAGLSLVIAADSVSEDDGAAATTATVSRTAGLTINRVDRGVGTSDGVFGSQSSSNSSGGGFVATIHNEDSGNSANFHEVDQNSSIDTLGTDGTGAVEIRDDPGFFAPISDGSFFDVYFDLTTTHTFTLTGQVFADSDAADALATLDLTGPGTLLSFSEASNSIDVGGQTDISETGTLLPGTYHFVARAEASSVGATASANADFVFDLQLQPAALVVNLSSDDTSEATVQATVTIAAGQTVSPVFDIDAVDDAIADGTQTVTFTATATAHTDGTDTIEVTDDEAASFTVTVTDGYTLVFEDGSTDTFDVVLDVQPASNVVINVTSGDTGEATVSPASLTFTDANWSVPQTVTVSGVDDPIVDGNQTVVVTLSVDDAASDDAFDGVANQTVNVTVADVDGSIRGTVWDDVDGNQTQNSEPGRPDVTVYLDLNRNGLFDVGEPTQVTAADGSYSFENLAPGEYVVAQIVPGGLAQTFPPVVGTAGTFAELINDQASLSVLAARAPRDVSRLFILEKNSGTIQILDLATGQLNSTPFLTIPDTDAGANESGLLGLAFHPDYANNGKFYVNVTVDNGGILIGGATSPFSTHIREYRVSADPDVADPASMREILSFVQPQGNHNGGWIGFSPNDGNLYIGTGDGGGGNDDEPGHTDPGGNGQDVTDNLLGKMLRIDVNGDDFPADADRNYAIPGTNPFVGQVGDDEIWAYGLRNPWRDSFDRLTGDLWIGDVGQNAREEVDFQLAASTGGENYGWRLREGFIATPTAGIGGPPPPGVIDPVYDYLHGSGPFEGNSLIGGYVYRGQVSAFAGLYIFADSRSSNVWSFDPADPINSVQRINDLLVPDAGAIGGGPIPDDIVSFAEDGSGNLYMVEIDGEIHKISMRLPGTHTVLVAADEVAADIDFGNQEPQDGSISNFVWHDLDADGIQETGETGLDGVTVNLLNGDTLAQIGTATTAGGGMYNFSGLAAGNYVVEFVTSGTFVFSPQDQGGDDLLDSDPDPISGRTTVIALAASTVINTVDAGLYQLATIGDRVWGDLDGDGIQENGEGGLNGIKVDLIGQHDDFQDGSVQGWIQHSDPGNAQQPFNVASGGPAGDGDAYIRFNSAGGNGAGSRLVVRNLIQWIGDLSGLATIEADVKNFGTTDHTLRIAIDGLGGWFASTNAAAQSLAAGSDWTRLTFSMDPSDFAAVGTATDFNATLSAVTELRLVNSAQPDFRGDPVAASAGIDNITAVLDQTTTAGDGNYGFSVEPGTYRVRYVAPSGHLFSPVDQGADDTIDSDADPGSGFTSPFMVSSGDNKDTVDAGLTVPDTTNPAITSFTRKTPTAENTNADTLVFLATFSEEVQGVGTADFEVNGTTTATVTSFAQLSPSTYDVTVSGGDLAGFNGVVGLNLSGSQNITDLAGNALPAGEPGTDETYTVDNIPPTVVSVVVGDGNPNRSGVAKLSFDFDQAVTVSSATALRVYNHTTSSSTTLSAATLLGNGTSTVTWDLSSVSLPNGRYTAELPAAEATDAAGLPLASTHSFEFHVLLGDVSGDGAVNFADFGVVGSNFDPPAGAAYRAGDADGNGAVNFDDFGVIGANFNPLGLAPLTYDLGDAPEASTNYPTTLDKDGAVHVIGSGLFLGTVIDAESEGQPHADALGDDNASDDEDGVTFGSLTAGSTANITVVATVPSSAVLNAWIDFNANGDWSDVGEQIFINEPLTDGSNARSFSIPSTAAVGDTFARFRVNTSAGYSFTGLAPDGEVEDYKITIAADSQTLVGTNGMNYFTTTDRDGNDAALQSILTEWSSNASYATRVDNIRTGGGSLGGIKLEANVTVHDDGSVDKMRRENSRDWFFADRDGADGDDDLLDDKRSNEEVDLLENVIDRASRRKVDE